VYGRSRAELFNNPGSGSDVSTGGESFDRALAARERTQYQGAV
jgi:hypothetical protein